MFFQTIGMFWKYSDLVLEIRRIHL